MSSILIKYLTLLAEKPEIFVPNEKGLEHSQENDSVKIKISQKHQLHP